MQCINGWSRWAMIRALVLLSVVVSGCRLGPEYVKPTSVADAAIQAPRFARATDPSLHDSPPLQPWWHQLSDPQLTSLIEEAFAQNPDLQAVEAKLLAARATAQFQSRQRLPTVGAMAGMAHITSPKSTEKSANQAAQPGAAIGAKTTNENLYLVGFDASWELDLFGRLQRANEQAQADTQAAKARLEDGEVRLAAEIGQLYTRYRSLQARIDIANAHHQSVVQTVQLVHRLTKQGILTQVDFERVHMQEQQEQAQLLELQAAKLVILDQLAVSVGQAPGTLDQRLAQVMPLPTLPAQVPIDNPAAVIRRRPDVREAEHQLMGANAQIGEAMAAGFPQIKLLGNIGMMVTAPSQFGWNAVSTAVAPLLQWSMVDFGRHRALVNRARANYQAQVATYQSVVLTALQDANSALSQFGASRDMYLLAQQTADSAARAEALIQQRFRAGVSPLTDVLDVLRQRLTAQDKVIQTQTELLVRFIVLQKALGLGWANQKALSDPTSSQAGL